MGVEASYANISNLNTSWPLGSDGKSDGDAHLRGIKAALTATLANVSDSVTPTHTELNYVDGVTSAIQTQIDSKAASAHTHSGYETAGTAVAMAIALGG